MREVKKKGTPRQNPTRLIDVLRSLPKAELESLAQRIGASIDRNLRADGPMQMARKLVTMVELRDTSRLGTAPAQLLRRLVEAGGVLQVRVVPPTLEPLAARGLVFARMHESNCIELVLPPAYLVQLPMWEGEDPRGIRALLAQSSAETQAAIASHYAGRPATHPIALPLEEAWSVLSNPEALAREIATLSSTERRLLDSVYQEGCEVDTEELLDLEREPLRLRNATGAAPSRRGVSFSLERRGMLIPVHPNRHIIPTEVAAIIGAEDVSSRKSKRAQIRAFVLDGDHEPRRARFALDPSPIAIALAMAAREGGTEVRETAGTPRSLLLRLSQRFGRDFQTVALLVALSRALGLWEGSSLSRATPPGAWSLSELGLALFRVWRQGGAWDEGRPEPEVLRLPPDARDSSPVRIVREIVLDALEDLAEGRWLPFEAIADWVRSDPRTPGVTRLLRRWALRVGLEPPLPTDIAQTIVLESLPALGILDVGEADTDHDVVDAPPLVRITPRGRAYFQGNVPQAESSSTAFMQETVLRIGSEAAVGSVLTLYPFCEVGKVDDTMEVEITNAAISRALASGVDGEVIRATISALVDPSITVAKALDQLSVVVGRITFVAASGFLWCDDPDVREMLRSRKQTAECFIDPSPPAGLLLSPTVSLDALARRCRVLGVEVISEGQVVRARSTIPPPMLDNSPARPSGARPTPRTDNPVRSSRSRKPSKSPSRPP